MVALQKCLEPFGWSSPTIAGEWGELDNLYAFPPPFLGFGTTCTCQLVPYTGIEVGLGPKHSAAQWPALSHQKHSVTLHHGLAGWWDPDPPFLSFGIFLHFGA